ncbi:MAG: type II toxin-antitoxin system VapC family toxin [Sphingobacteriaceae bacterium]|nr:MAG: type II toxin-antitoxin system VapC family toxin [Sphingobacteriaceae bacterium]
MSGTDIFIDTNICIYLLNGDAFLAESLQDLEVYISIITEMELYAYHGNDESKIKVLDEFIESVNVLNINKGVKENTILIRKNNKLKLPDSIIAASALSNNLPLMTADKLFHRVSGLDLVFYEKS